MIRSRWPCARPVGDSGTTVSPVAYSCELLVTRSILHRSTRHKKAHASKAARIQIQRKGRMGSGMQNRENQLGGGTGLSQKNSERKAREHFGNFKRRGAALSDPVLTASLLRIRLLLVVWLSACASSAVAANLPVGVTSAPLAPRSVASGATMITEMPADQTGVVADYK